MAEPVARFESFSVTGGSVELLLVSELDEGALKYQTRDTRFCVTAGFRRGQTHWRVFDGKTGASHVVNDLSEAAMWIRERRRAS